MTRKMLFWNPLRSKLLLCSIVLIILVVLSNKIGHTNPMRVAIIKSRSMEPYEDAIRGFKKYFREKKISVNIEEYNLKGELKSGSKIIKSIHDDQTDYILTVGSEAYQAIKSKKVAIPIVISMMYSPIEDGVINDERKKTIYGVSLKVSFKRRLQMVKKLIPNLNKIAIIYHTDKKMALEKQLKYAAKESKVHLKEYPIASLKAFIPTLKKAIKETDGLLMILDKRIYNSGSAREMLMLSARSQYPIIAISSNYVKSGALMSISSDFYGNGSQAGELIGEIMVNDVKNQFQDTNELIISWNQNVSRAYGINLSMEGKEYVNKWY